jgi:hypothetical protein
MNAWLRSARAALVYSSAGEVVVSSSEMTTVQHPAALGTSVTRPQLSAPTRRRSMRCTTRLGPLKARATQLALTLTLTMSLLLNWTLPQAGAVTAAERVALLDLYSATNGPQWSVSTSWLSGDPCSAQWFGVGCSGLGSSASVVYVQ